MADIIRPELLAVIETPVMSLEEAYEFAGIKRPSKLLRMLRALWRVKDA